MLQIAMYGKGGIGKSTISSNLSAILAERKKRVLQIGCDPKHDSVRLLLGGASIPTVLNYIRHTLPEDRCLEDIMFEGYAGVACIEAGGPEPGVGCAGRGILTTFEVLENLGIRSIPFDVVLYDVLGDVVCGGFALPVRKNYADAIFIVSSGEFMSLYAANNILKGISNLNTGPRIAGIVHNSRGLPEEDARVAAFATAVGLPVIVSVPRDEAFAAAEKAGKTLVEFSPGSSAMFSFHGLADHIEGIVTGSTLLYPAQALDDDELGSLVYGKVECPPARSYDLGRLVPDNTSTPRSKGKELFLTSSMKHMRPLAGCSFAGAVTATSQIRGALTIIHGPRSCAHIVSHFLTSTSLKSMSRYGTPLSGHWESLFSTDMGERAFIFGGMDELHKSLEIAQKGRWDAIFVVSTCPSGLIGDDITKLADGHFGNRVIPVAVDGNIAGDFAQGLVEGYKKVMELVDDSILPEKGYVNIIGEKVLSSNCDFNYGVICELLEKIGLTVNCRFLSKTTVADIANFKKAELNLLAHNDDAGKVMQRSLESELGCEFFGLPFPVGYKETAEWLELLAERFLAEDKVSELLSSTRVLYEREMAQLRPLLKGKRILISSFSHNLDWILETAFELGMQVLKVGITVPYDSIDLRSRFMGMVPLEYDYSSTNREKDIEELAPDIVLSSHPPLVQDGNVRYDLIPTTPDVGFNTGLILARRWHRLLNLPVIEGWKLDGDAHDI